MSDDVGWNSLLPVLHGSKSRWWFTKFDGAVQNVYRPPMIQVFHSLAGADRARQSGS